MNVRKIENIGDVIKSLSEVREAVLTNKMNSSMAYATNSCVSRMMSAVHAQIRYAKARGEIPYVPFMHVTPRAPAAKQKK